jgi:hypothetical protein
MIASNRFIRVVILAGCLLLAALQGCSMFGQNPKATRQQKAGPQTVGEWMNQPRVKP